MKNNSLNCRPIHYSVHPSSYCLGICRQVCSSSTRLWFCHYAKTLIDLKCSLFSLRTKHLFLSSFFVGRWRLKIFWLTATWMKLWTCLKFSPKLKWLYSMIIMLFLMFSKALYELIWYYSLNWYSPAFELLTCRVTCCSVILWVHLIFILFFPILDPYIFFLVFVF